MEFLLIGQPGAGPRLSPGLAPGRDAARRETRAELVRIRKTQAAQNTDFARFHGAGVLFTGVVVALQVEQAVDEQVRPVVHDSLALRVRLRRDHGRRNDNVAERLRLVPRRRQRRLTRKRQHVGRAGAAAVAAVKTGGFLVADDAHADLAPCIGDGGSGDDVIGNGGGVISNSIIGGGGIIGGGAISSGGTDGNIGSGNTSGGNTSDGNTSDGNISDGNIGSDTSGGGIGSTGDGNIGDGGTGNGSIGNGDLISSGGTDGNIGSGKTSDGNIGSDTSGDGVISRCGVIGGGIISGGGPTLEIGLRRHPDPARAVGGDLHDDFNLAPGCGMGRAIFHAPARGFHRRG